MLAVDHSDLESTAAAAEGVALAFLRTLGCLVLKKRLGHQGKLVHLLGVDTQRTRTVLK